MLGHADVWMEKKNTHASKFLQPNLAQSRNCCPLQGESITTSKKSDFFWQTRKHLAKRSHNSPHPGKLWFKDFHSERKGREELTQVEEASTWFHQTLHMMLCYEHTVLAVWPRQALCWQSIWGRNALCGRSRELHVCPLSPVNIQPPHIEVKSIRHHVKAECCPSSCHILV